MGTLGLDFFEGIYLGIDFGTTNSVVSIFDYDADEVYTVPIDGNMIFPTVIQFENDEDNPGKLGAIFGAMAKESAIIFPESTILSIKRLLGKDQPIKVVVDDVAYDFKPEDIVAQIIGYLKQSASAYIHEEKSMLGEFSGLVITVPANSNDKQKSKMRQAAIAAGFLDEHVHLRLEPAAAAISYAKIATEDAKVLVYDFGGGTFDACLLQMTDMDADEPEINILSTYGDNNLGGNDLDKLMMDMIYDRFLDIVDGAIDLFDQDKDDGVSKKQKKMALVRLIQVASQAKERLSSTQSTKIVLAPFLQEPELINLNLEISREAYYNHKRKYQLGDSDDLFEQLKGKNLIDLVDKTMACTQKCLDAASVNASEVDEIFLVGGSSALPEVEKQIKATFNKEPFKSKISPALSISQGAAYYCNMIMLPGSMGPKVHEKTIHPLGLEIAGRRFLEIIGEGIEIPEEGLVIESEEPLFTNFDDITSMAIAVYEDTEPDGLPKHLKFVHEPGMKRLAGTTLKGIPKASKGEEKVRVIFEVNRENILTVRAVSTSTDGLETALSVDELY